MTRTEYLRQTDNNILLDCYFNLTKSNLVGELFGSSCTSHTFTNGHCIF